jgi:hypothetical protein
LAGGRRQDGNHSDGGAVHGGDGADQDRGGDDAPGGHSTNGARVTTPTAVADGLLTIDPKGRSPDSFRARAVAD